MTVSLSPGSREGWARVSRAAASYARIQAADPHVYYGSVELRRIARANAKRDLEDAIRRSLEDGAPDAWILDAVLAGGPTLDAIDAWMELDDAREGPERRAELIRSLSGEFLRGLRRGPAEQEGPE